jgi:uncharacterized protein YbaR (Trm112 family)
MQTLYCPMCRQPLLTLALRSGDGALETRCQNRHCTGRPLVRFEVADGVAVVRSLDRAPATVVG